MKKATQDIPVTKVTVASGQVAFPQRCCCCGAASDRQVIVEREKRYPVPVPILGTGAVVRFGRKLRVQIPSCATCEPGMRWHSSDAVGGWILGTIGMFLLILVGLSVLAAFVSALTGVLIGQGADGWAMMALAAVLAVVWLRSRIRKKRPKPLSAEHLCTTLVPARVKTFDTNSVTFVFVREAYANAFAEANQTLRVETSTLSREIF